MATIRDYVNSKIAEYEREIAALEIEIETAYDEGKPYTAAYAEANKSVAEMQLRRWQDE